jgi:hypothetical protein
MGVGGDGAAPRRLRDSLAADGLRRASKIAPLKGGLAMICSLKSGKGPRGFRASLRRNRRCVSVGTRAWRASRGEPYAPASGPESARANVRRCCVSWRPSVVLASGVRAQVRCLERPGGGHERRPGAGRPPRAEDCARGRAADQSRSPTTASAAPTRRSSFRRSGRSEASVRSQPLEPGRITQARQPLAFGNQLTSRRSS